MAAEKPFPPSPKKLRDARRQGDVPRSRDATSLVALGIGIALVPSLVSGILDAFRAHFAVVLAFAQQPHGVIDANALSAPLSDVLALTLPVAAAISVGAAITTWVVQGPVFEPSLVFPRLDRLDPASGLAQRFSARAWFELGKALLVLSAIAWVLYDTYVGAAPTLGRAVGPEPHRGIVATIELLTSAAARLLGLWVLVALADVLVERWRFQRKHAMSREEVERETKESEGDPHHRAERQRAHREITAHSILESVRSADVLVVNPTHLAVALRYDQEGESVPEVVAKGAEELASKMIAAAEEAGVPVLQDVPLAHSLFELEEGATIPEELFDAVAAILQAAWRIRGERSG